MKRISCDVLVIGGGGGGLRAALAVKEASPGLKVILATKGVLGRSGVTASACSDRMAFHATLPHTEPRRENAWIYHARDIYKIGGQVSDGNLARILAENAEDAFNYLDRLGVPFVRKGGVVDQFITDGSDFPRACYTGPKTAVHIEEALVKKIKTTDIQIWQHCMVVKLLIEAGAVAGAVALDTRVDGLDSALTIMETGNIILASGGAGKVYKHNVFPAGATGDAFALAYDVGAEMVNMEFIQIGIASTKTKLNCSGSAMRAVPRFINDKREEFLPAYFPGGTSLQDIHNYVFQKGASWPVTFEHKTHVIDIAVYKEINKGSKVYLDYAANPRGFSFSDLPYPWKERYRCEMTINLGLKKRGQSPLNRLKEINSASIEWLKEHGIDLELGELVEIAACVQHFQGGVKIGEGAETGIKGLYAVGECAGGQHGANRPGGNALLDCQVFGKIAGMKAALRASESVGNLTKVNEAKIAGLLAFLRAGDKNKETLTVRQVRKKMQNVMNGTASIVRTKAGLGRALQDIQALKKARWRRDGKGYAFVLETLNMLTVAEMILRAAILRDESRGPHLTFADYMDNMPREKKDPQWQKYIVIRKRKGKMDLSAREPRPLLL